MPTVRIHPIQREFTVSGRTQTCDLCGAEERWTARAEPPVEGPALQRTLHLVHLVRAHLREVQDTFAGAERGKETLVPDGADNTGE